MRRRFRLSLDARADVKSAWEYLSKNASVDIADQVIDDLYAGMDKLSETPGIGHWRKDLTDLPLRFYLVHRYLIIYEPKKKPLWIVRVLHSARDIPSILHAE